MAWPSPYPPHRPTSSSSPYPPYQPPPATSQLSSLNPSLPPTSPATRTTPSLSRSTTYLASLGPSLARPPPPPTSAPALQGHFFEGAARDRGAAERADENGAVAPFEEASEASRTRFPARRAPPSEARFPLPGSSPQGTLQGEGGDRRHSAIGMGERGWNGPSPSFSSSRGRNGYASKPPVTGRPELPHKSASSPTPTISSSATTGNSPSSGGGGRKLQKPRRSSPSHSPYPPSSPTTTFAPFAPPSPAFPSPYPHPPAPARSPYPSYNPSSAPPTAHSSPTFPVPMPPLAPVQSDTPAAYPGGVQRMPSLGPYPAYTPPPPPPGARVASFSSADVGGSGDAAEVEKMRIRREEEEALARIHLESLALESTRLASLASRETALLNRTLEASTHDHLRSEALERERERQEEAAVRAAVEESRREEEERQRRLREAGPKGKGRAVEEGAQGREEEEDVWARREREALEMAMRLSMEDSGRYEGGGRGGSGGGRVETSAEAFRRLSRPAALENFGGVAALAGECSPSPHPLFQHPTASPPSTSTSAPLPSEPSSSSSTAVDLPPPPAYEHPAHASELDEPDDVMVGPGRPLPPPPAQATSVSLATVAPPPPPPGAAPASFHPASQQPYPVYSRSPPSPAAGPPPQQQQQQQHHHPLFSSSSAFTRDTYPPPLAASEVGSFAAAPSTISAQARSFVSSAYESYQPSVHGGERADDCAGGGGGLASSPEGQANAVDPFADEFSVQEHASPASSPPKDLFASAMAARRASLRSLPSTSPSLSVPSPRPPSRRPPDLPLEAVASSSPRPSIVVETDRSYLRDSSPSTATPGGAGSAGETPVAEVRPSPPLSTQQADTSLLSPPPPTASSASLSPSSSLAPSPSPSLSTTSFHSTPSHGGLVSVPSSSAAPFARQDVLDSVRWGFVDPERAAMHPPLEYEGDFPRAAQLSCTRTRTGEGGEVGEEEGEGKEMFRCFAVEAKGWQSLLVYLMWHGNSRLEAAPSDLQSDKSNRGLQASVSLDFFRSFSTHQPRVRITLTLLPLSHAAPLPPTANSPFSALPVDPPLFEEECPSIRFALPAPLTLPLPLSAIATALSHAHTASRQTLRVLTQGVIGGSVGGGVGPSSATSRLLSDRATLARAIDLFRRLNGEKVVSEEEGGRGGDEAEVSTLDRLKARLRRTKKARVIGGGVGGSGAGGSGRPAGGPLPEGAMLITPFSLD